MSAKSLWRLSQRMIVELAMAAFLFGCAVTPRYNSLDLALLPCESGDSPVFFRAIEFDGSGLASHAQQVKAFHERFERGPPVTDLVVFVHGWNKNPSSAELDYQNFLCRLHGRLRNVIGDEKRAEGLIVLGIFWPSTITNREQEPWLLKPLSYYQIRDRADRVAEVGLATLLNDLRSDIKKRGAGSPVRVHLIGHSFGGRMVVRSLEVLHRKDELVPFLLAADAVNVVLINAAVSATRFDWISEAVLAAQRKKSPIRFSQGTASYLFNMHSFKDSANRTLFPLASMFNDDESACAAGACGVPRYPTLCVNQSGQIEFNASAATHETQGADRLNTWNVDVSEIVFDHSDIYKGRVATLIADLLYDEEKRQQFPVDSTNPATELRCKAVSRR